MTPTLVAIIAYLVIQFGIGLWVARRIHTEADYLIGGRSLGLGLATFSIFATWFGAETIVGSAGATYDGGVSLQSAEPFGYGLCLILMGLVFAVPLWRRKLTTLADLFRERYGKTVEQVAAVILIPGSILWAAAQVRAFGQVLSTASGGMDVELAIGIAALLTILYTALGGLLADAITDMIQGAVLAVGLIVILAVLTASLGGVPEAASVMIESGRRHLIEAPPTPLLATIEEWAIPVCGSVVATELVGRVIATRSEGVARTSSLLAGGLYITLGLIPVLVGLAGAAVVPELADSEQIIPAVAQTLLPTVLFAVFAGSLISAILSTVDSTLLIASGLLSHNLIVPLFGVREDRGKVWVARVGVMVFGVIAYSLAVRAEGVFDLVEQASAFGSAGALVTVSFALFTPFGGSRTALATLLAGMASYLVGSFGDFDYPFLFSLVCALATYVLGAIGGPLMSKPIEVTA